MELDIVKERGTETLSVRFAYKSELVQFVKTIDGYWYHPRDRFWTVPLTKDNVSLLSQKGFALSEKVSLWCSGPKKVATTKISVKTNLRQDLFPFQQTGVNLIEHFGGRALLGDDQGIGKTAQTIGWLSAHPKLRPVIVVTPASIKLNWLQEIQNWMVDEENIQIVSGKSCLLDPDADMLIINYDIVAAYIKKIARLKPKVLVLDESHYLKDPKTKRTKAVTAIARSIPHVIALSGTPIVNRPVEAFSVVSIIQPGLFKYWNFVQKYCGAKKGPFGWDFTGHSNTEELHDILVKTMLIRRKKSEVLSELPDKIRSMVPLQIDTKEYDAAYQIFLRGLADKSSFAKSVLAKVEYLRQLSVAEKMPLVVEWIEDFLDDSDQKLIVFAHHKSTIDILMNHFGKLAVKIDGSVTSEVQRQEAVNRFQRDNKIRLFIGNIKAAGVGITLTAASSVAFIELPWTPGELVQAEDRAHRIGQKNAVTIYYLFAANTIEEKMAKMLCKKAKVLGAVLDGKAKQDKSLLEELLLTLH